MRGRVSLPVLVALLLAAIPLHASPTISMESPSATPLALPLVPNLSAGAAAKPTPTPVASASTGAAIKSAAMRRAADAFNQKDFETVLKIAETRFREDPNDPEVINLRGAALSELRRFDEARPVFEEALRIKPDHFWARFNLIEMDFMSGKFPVARQGFEAMKPRGKAEDELLDFKIVLTHLAENNTDAAQSVADTMPFPCESAAWYASRAALAFHMGDRSRAHEYLAESERVFPGALSGFLLQTLTDFGMSPSQEEFAATPRPVAPVQPADPDADPDARRFTLDFRDGDFSIAR